MTTVRDKPIRVVIVARSIGLCKTISQALVQGGLEVAATAGSISEGLKKIQACRPNAVLLDLSFHKQAGSTLIERVMRALPVPVLLVSQLTDDEIPAAIEALSLGAFDVVGAPGSTTPSGRRQAPEEIVGAVRVAVRKWRSEGWWIGTVDGQRKTSSGTHNAPSRISVTL